MSMSTSRLVRSLVVAAGICVLAGAGPGGRVRGQQQQPPAETPTFRTDASFVLTDVFVTADGKPVTDLTQADFEVKEDGVVQTIRSFEAILHTTQPVGAAAPQPVHGRREQRDDRRPAAARVRGVPRHVSRRPRRLDGGPQGAAGLPEDRARPRRPGRLHDPAHVGARHQLLELDRPAAPLFRRQPGLGPGRRIARHRNRRGRAQSPDLFHRQRRGLDSAALAAPRAEGDRVARRAGVAPRRPARIAQGGDRGDAGLAAVPRERAAHDRQGHAGTRRRRGAARRRPGRQAGLSGSQPRQRIERQDLRQRPHAGLVRQQPPDVHGSDRPGEPVEHELLHRRRGRPAHRDAPAHRHAARSHGRGPQPRARAVLDAPRFDPHARRVDQRHGHRRHQQLRRGPAPRRRRLQLLLSARLHVDQRQAGREVPQDQGHREAARRAGARPRRLPGASRRRTRGELDVERRESWARARIRPTRS